jgi:murein DD-endopeptidase MepM/ murein hydrolase activator NlpD
MWLAAGVLASLAALSWVGRPVSRGTAHFLPATAHRALPTATDADTLPAAALAAARSLASTSARTLAALRGARVAEVSPGPTTVQVVVGRNDTLDSIFRRLQVSRADLGTLRRLPGLEQDLDRLRPGETLTLVHLGREFVGLTWRMSLAETLTVERSGSSLRARVIENPLQTRTRTVSGTIDRSLFEAMAQAGGHEQTALALGSLFAWDIDFLNDLRPGDSFTVTYSEIDQNGRYAEDGPILAARFVNRGHEYLAVRYAAPDGKAAYYTPNGRNLRKAFLRFPLAFTRVSSPFNLHRFHPILHRIRAHTGVDYAAPMGTPVHAVGDGKVAFVGRKGGYGNAVEIDHGHGIMTLYGHLSRFAHGIRSGLRVTQGEVIAFVGMTGLATGPHLHYEYRVNGVYKNPQTVSLPDAVPISPGLRADFLGKTAPLLASLFPPAGPALVSR